MVGPFLGPEMGKNRVRFPTFPVCSIFHFLDFPAFPFFHFFNFLLRATNFSHAEARPPLETINIP